MDETIRIGGLFLEFLHDRDDTEGSVDVFRMSVLPKAKVPVPHHHESWDETVYGFDGEMTFRIGDREVGLTVGETLFIPRGTVHAFRNDGPVPATCLVVLTPGVLGIDYFREVAALLASDTPDLAQMGAIMRRYGLIPAPLN